MRTILLPLAILALLASSGVVRADDIDMKNGRTFSGKILSESDDEISLEWRGGVMKIARAQIKEIRRGPAPAGTEPAPAPAPAPSPEPPAKSGARGSSLPAGKSSPAASPNPGKGASGKKTAKDLLVEIDSIQLERWDYVPSVPAKPDENKGYKVVGSDGRESLKDALPASADGVVELWVRQQNGGGGYVFYKNGAAEMLWHRLYWHADSHDWQQVSVGESAFNRDTYLCARIVDLVAKDFNYVIAANCSEEGIKNVLQRDRAAPAAKERKELRENCAKAMGTDAGGELLAKIHELNVEAAFSKSGRKVEIARERREALRQLAALCAK
jgi:hypothetical protein